MPELHKLMPLLANMQQAGQRVALVTDGRMSGASGQVSTALHVTRKPPRGQQLWRGCRMATGWCWMRSTACSR